MALTVSVALCTLDGEAHIEQQLASILAQTRLPDELVVSDDGSTDGTLGVVERVLDGAPFATRVLRHRRRQGVTANFASAVSDCHGALVVLSDQDDVWRPDRIERSAAAFEADPDLLLLHSDADLIDGDGRELPGGLLASLPIRSVERALIETGRGFEAYLRRNLATGATVMFRQSLLDQALPFPDEFVHDEWLALIAAAVGPVRLEPERLIAYRQHGANAIGAPDPGLARRLRRMSEPRGERYARLARRAALLEARLVRIGADESIRTLAQRKARFEERRAAYPRARVARLPHVARRWAAGDYRKLSSQGDADVIRDLVQPA